MPDEMINDRCEDNFKLPVEKIQTVKKKIENILEKE